MRILVATAFTIPAYSGGWTTPLDLFGDEHSAMYVIRNWRAGSRTIEGVPCTGVGCTGPFTRQWKRGDRFRFALVQRLFRSAIRRSFDSFGADFVLCLDPQAGFAAMDTGLPYVMRIHSKLSQDRYSPAIVRLLENAVFSTSCPSSEIEGVEVMPHNQDLSRFVYRESPAAERALLLTSINLHRDPDVFLEGVMLSRQMKGDIVGTGDERRRIASLCRKTGGRVRCLDPVPRLQVPELLSGYQIGVATVKPVVKAHYQMKVNDYMASGLFTLAMPWTHIASEAPELVRVFGTAEELAGQLDYLQENWSGTVGTRRRARDWVLENYSVEIPRKRFRELLAEHFPGRV
jgi:hypothetical protein